MDMGDLSKHFSREEVECKCGCGFDSIDVETLKIMEEVREYVKHPITPSSGARCSEHNKKVGGLINSQHLKTRACDLPVDVPSKVYEWLNNKYPNKYGFGLYKAFVHIDTRAEKARWTN